MLSARRDLPGPLSLSRLRDRVSRPVKTLHLHLDMGFRKASSSSDRFWRCGNRILREERHGATLIRLQFRRFAAAAEEVRLWWIIPNIPRIHPRISRALECPLHTKIPFLMKILREKLRLPPISDSKVSKTYTKRLLSKPAPGWS